MRGTREEEAEDDDPLADATRPVRLHGQKPVVAWKMEARRVREVVPVGRFLPGTRMDSVVSPGCLAGLRPIKYRMALVVGLEPAAEPDGTAAAGAVIAAEVAANAGVVGEAGFADWTSPLAGWSPGRNAPRFRRPCQ